MVKEQRAQPQGSVREKGPQAQQGPLKGPLVQQQEVEEGALWVRPWEGEGQPVLPWVVEAEGGTQVQQVEQEEGPGVRQWEVEGELLVRQQGVEEELQVQQQGVEELQVQQGELKEGEPQVPLGEVWGWGLLFPKFLVEVVRQCHSWEQEGGLQVLEWEKMAEGGQQVPQAVESVGPLVAIVDGLAQRGPLSYD